MIPAIFDNDGEWYSKAITGYIVTASALTVAIATATAAGVV
ncbi:hypothetical protein [Halobiforma nitratireducens]|nr:hypothetical protein [Halobiforma nitratireducens]